MTTPLFSGVVSPPRVSCARPADSTATEVVTMKIIRSTRKMSVSGVMLISQNIAPPPVGELIAISLLPRDGGVDQTGGADMDRGVDALDALREIVVENDGDNRDGQAERSRNQRLGDSCRDDREAAGPHYRHRLERGEDADHRAEKADEGRGGTRCRKHPNRAPQLHQFGEAALLIDSLEAGT